MPFTDDHLKQLKESLATYKLTDFVSGVTSERLLALIARLECAEECVGKASLCPSLEWDKYYEAWLQSAGRGGSK